MFWIYLIREIISMLNIEYSELLLYVGLYNKLKREPNSSISTFWDTRIQTELLDHALVDILQPTTPTIFQNDLEKLGFKILRGPKCENICHKKKDLFMVFHAKKVQNNNVTVEELEFRNGINQLDLNYSEEVKTIIKDYFIFKDWLRQQDNKDTAAILAILYITNVFNEIDDKIPYGTFSDVFNQYIIPPKINSNIYGIHPLKKIRRLFKWLMKNPELLLSRKNLFWEPEQYFYKKLKEYFDSIKNQKY